MPAKTPTAEIPIKIWAPTEEVEAIAMKQLHTVAALPWAFHHVAVMPDVHAGVGCTVGSVIAMKDAISPAAVGVDIGCGMSAVRTNLPVHQLPDNLADLRGDIEAVIPVGFNWYEEPVAKSTLFERFDELHPGVQDLKAKTQRQLGTLGGGNHFVEISIDTKGLVWLMLHSGSRGIGNKLAQIHIEIAQKLAHNQALPDRDLAVFLAKTPEMAAYRHDLSWAQEYALQNRQVMLHRLQAVIAAGFPGIDFAEPIHCHHNYVAEEMHFGEEVLVTRKGAISARAGQLGVIPGSMGAKSYIVSGLGNPDSFNSASHGAGRRMSRGQAKRTFTIADLEAQTAGVECRKDEGVLDEIPGAYKDIDKVMANQKDLVTIIAELKAVLCVKG